MERFISRKSEHAISFSVFDVLYVNGNKITNLSLLDRKEILTGIIPEDNALLNKVQWIEGNAIQYFELIKHHDLEGIVQKKSDSKYQINKRSNDWIKVINYQYDEVYISGIRKNEFGLLLNFQNGKYAGLMELVPTSNKMEF
jgi:DNA ligase-1